METITLRLDQHNWEPMYAMGFFKTSSEYEWNVSQNFYIKLWTGHNKKNI